ncbi:hypothetical protein [Pseudomonas sp. Pseusp97]|uniref:hypothetical protein n=1 Tax=Pseudomonas sp. Pseusp97 TaxID=3243065 RepID=UPI0039A5EB6D
MASLIELFVQLLLVDSIAHDRDAPTWIKRYRKPLRIALILSAVVVLPLLGLVLWRLITG